MKKRIIIISSYVLVIALVFFVAFKMNLFRRTDKTEEKIQWLFDQMYTAQFKESIEQMNKMMYMQFGSDLPEKTLQQIEAINHQSFESIISSIKGHSKDFTAVYRKYFTDSEINDLINFYKTEVGTKALKNAGPLAAEIGMILQPALAPFTQKIIQEFSKPNPDPAAFAPQTKTAPEASLNPTEKNILWLVEQTTMGSLKDSLDQMVTSMIPTGSLNDQQKAAMKNLLASLLQEISVEFTKNIKKVSQIYLKYFTDAEIEQMVQFYKSGCGKKMLENLGALSSDMMNILQPELLKLMESSAKAMEPFAAEIKAAQEKKISSAVAPKAA
jgi:hypothetical protein